MVWEGEQPNGARTSVGAKSFFVRSSTSSCCVTGGSGGRQAPSQPSVPTGLVVRDGALELLTEPMREDSGRPSPWTTRLRVAEPLS